MEFDRQKQHERLITDDSVSILRANGTINGHKYVDLGLSVKWAICNVGANSPEAFGDYFAWGETTTKSTYTNENSAIYGKNVGDISGKLNYDAARANWGGTWRIPTLEEIMELKNNCTTQWITLYGVKGMLVTSKINGNSIFLPAAGYWRNKKVVRSGEFGNYWAAGSCKDTVSLAFTLAFSGENPYSSSHFGAFFMPCVYGQSVRPVSDLDIF